MYDATLYLKELDLLQGCITRMAKNSFVIKGMAIFSLFAGLAIAPLLNGVTMYLYIAALLCMITMYWRLDAYFLRMERAYRNLYDHVRCDRWKKDELPDEAFCLNPSIYLHTVDTVGKVMMSETLFPMYGFMKLFAVLWIILVMV